MPIDKQALDRALEKYEEARRELAALASQPRSTEEIGCSFCCRPKSQVRGVVAGPGVFICDECVVLCHRVLKEQGHIA